MNVSTNESTKEVTSEIKQWTGLCNVTVLAVCPDLEALKVINFAPKKEPVYVGEKDGKPNMRIDFIIKNSEINVMTKLAFFLEPKERLTKDGDKCQYTNLLGQFTWGTLEGLGSNTPTWFVKENFRKAIVGEEALILFIRNWCNVEQGKPCGFSSLEEAMTLAKGNVGVLRNLHAAVKSNPVKVLLGVKRDGNNFWQSVYNKHFARSYSKSTTPWIKRLEDKYGKFADDYQGDLTL